MSKLIPSKDIRTTYDPKTGAVRSFFGADLVEPPAPGLASAAAPAAAMKSEEKTDDFLAANRDVFRFENIDLARAETREGGAVKSVRYLQRHNGVLVYNAQLVVGMRRQDQAIMSAINKVDYEIPPALGAGGATLSGEQAAALVNGQFAGKFADVTMGEPVLYIYRHVLPEQLPADFPLSAIRQEMLSLGAGKPGHVYLAWQILMDTKSPDGQWELFVDAGSGALLAVHDRRRYAARQAYVFLPDPIRASQDTSLSSSTPTSTLNPLRSQVTLQNLADPVNGTYSLDGAWVRSRDREQPDYAPPSTAVDFKYDAQSRGFLCVSAYYWLDRFITDLRGLGVTQFNQAVTGPLEVDAVGVDGADNSYFVVPVNGAPYIAFGEGGVPDASDPGVVVHEYGHALHYFLGSQQTYANEHMFCDFLAAGWVDRHNDNQFVREQMFPWDNNQGNQWSSFRRVDLTQRYDDPGYAGYAATLQGAIGATALWDWFLNIGGASAHADVRKRAANEVIRTYMDMLVNTAQHASTWELAMGLLTADEAATGGLYKKVIWDAFRRRGLWSDFTPAGNIDLYIRDDANDTGSHAGPEVCWNSPDIWVRNNPPPADPDNPLDPNYGENPDAGPQAPVNDAPNYVYVRVRNRGSLPAPANSFSVEAFRCAPVAPATWPASFISMGSISIPVEIPPGGSVRVGPFAWTPTIQFPALPDLKECLFAIVRGEGDPSIADEIAAHNRTADYVQLVRFDNNIAQLGRPMVFDFVKPIDIGPLIWAWVIIIGGLIITPGGVECIVCGPAISKLLGLVSIVLGGLGYFFGRNASSVGIGQAGR